MLNRLFAGRNEPKATTHTPAEAISNLRKMEEMLLMRQEFLENKVGQEMEVIRRNGTNNKRVSLQALKRKKRLEKQLEQIDGTLTTIEYQRESLENAKTNTEVLKVMGYAAKTLELIHADINIDKVENLMDDVREQQQLADEISQVISNPAMFGQDVDEDELLKELEDMERQEIDQKLLDTEPTLNLPQVLTTLPDEMFAESTSASASTVAKEKEADKELAELAAWAN